MPLVVGPTNPEPEDEDMRVGEVMTRGVEVAGPNDTLRQAAGRMAELDAGPAEPSSSGRGYPPRGGQTGARLGDVRQPFEGGGWETG